MITNEMMYNLNMLGSRMLNGIFWQMEYKASFPEELVNRFQEGFCSKNLKKRTPKNSPCFGIQISQVFLTLNTQQLKDSTTLYND